MAKQNVGKVAAVIKSETAPTRKDVIWAHVTDPQQPNVTTLKVYDHDAGVWDALPATYKEDNTYSQYGTNRFIVDTEPYTQSLHKLDEKLYEAYPNVPVSLTYDSNNSTVAWDMAGRRLPQAVYNITANGELTFTISLSNYLNGGWGTLLIKQDIDGTIEATVPSNSNEDSDFANGDGKVTINGSSGQWHLLTVFIYNDGTNDHFMWNVQSYDTA